MRVYFFVLALTVWCGFVLLMRPAYAGSSAAKRGQDTFATNGCAHCHGPNGVGGNRGPDLQMVRKRLKRDAILRQIHDGGNGMPPYGDKLTEEQIHDLVAFLEEKRPYVAPLAAPAAPPPNKDSDDGH